MIFIILSWLYITAVSFPIGFLFTNLIKRIFRVQETSPLHFTFICINGLLFTSFIVSVWSLFYKVDLLANVAVFALALFSFITSRKAIADVWKQYWAEVKGASRINWTFFLLFIIIISGISYLPSSHADDAGAFSPLIKWIQEYKATPGIANLDSRYGYNSTWFQLQALYGFAFLKVGLFNDLNGLLFVLVLIYALQGVEKLLKNNKSFRNFLQAFFLLPVLLLYFGYKDDVLLYTIQFFTCPTYDVPVTFITWLVFFLFLDLRNHSGSFASSLKAHLVVLYIAYLVTVKLNAVPLGIIGLFVVGKILWEKKFRNAIVLCLMGIGIIIPWMSRTVISCGYLLFPYSDLNLLHADWKLTARSVLYIENSVMSWSIDPDIYGSPEYGGDSKHFSVPVKEWFPIWFDKLNFINSLIFYSTIGSIAGFFIYGLLRFAKAGKSFFTRNSVYIVLYITLLAGIALWFFKGPMFRYGYLYLLFGTMIMVSGAIYYFLREYKSYYVGVAIWVFFLYTVVYYKNNIFGYCKDSFFKGPPPITAPTYTRVDMGKGLYINIVEGAHCGNAPLPCSPRFVFEFLRPQFRGNSINEGFRNQRPKEELFIEKGDKK